MRRSLRLLFAAIVVTALPVGPVRADRPEFLLELSSAKDKVALGEEISLTVHLEKKRGRPVEIDALRLARNSVSIEVQVAGRTHLVTRIYGEIRPAGDGGRMKLVDTPPPRTILTRDRPLSLSVPLLAIRPGELVLRARYAGLGEDAGVLVSDPVDVEVTAGKGQTGLGARIETTEGTMVFEMWPDRAFNTVLTFLSLADRGFYDGLTIHRILPGYLVQGGDPRGDGTGGPGFRIPDEPDPSAKHVRGVLSLARVPGVPDSGGSQFFVMLGPAPRLDGLYTAFGRLVEGDKVLDHLAALPLVDAADGETSLPKEPPIIRSVRPVPR